MRKSLAAFLPLVLFLASPEGARPALASPAGATAPAHADPVYRVPLAGLPSMGDARALVTIVAFTDYECPYCKRAEETIGQLRTTYGQDLRVVVAERPLPMHEHARGAALAALAADAQGGYEAMRRALYASPSLEESAVLTAARSLSLDPARLASDRAGAAVASLERAETLATGLHVQGTPTFFVNGRRVTGAQPMETFKSVVDERLAAARALVASGVRPEDVYAMTIATGLGSVVDETGPDSCNHDCNAAQEAEQASDKVETPRTEGAPSRGPASAPITIVEYADYECSYCAKAESTVRAVEAAHPNQVRVVFMQRPLPMHEHAHLYALAAGAAGAQGRFWDMHTRLFGLQAPVDRAGLAQMAREMGLDVDRFTRDIDDPATAERLAADVSEGDSLAINGTPTFFVNGRRVVGAQPEAAFEQAIQRSQR